jgi:hypothetical protein
MARHQCTACHGTYSDELADGTRYFHACPPLSVVEVAAAVKTGRIPFPAGTTLADYQAKAAAAGLPASAAPTLAAVDLVAVTTFERGDKRDENVPSTAEADAGKLKAVGAGRIPAVAVSPVVVVGP